MSLESELYQVFQKSTKAAKKPEILKAPAPVTPPVSARVTFSFYNPDKSGPDLILQVRETKARVYVWRNGKWSIKSPEETADLVIYAKAQQKRLEEAAAQLRKIQDFVAGCRAIRLRNQAKEERDSLLASIEEIALRGIVKAKTLEERMKINDEKESMEDEIFDAFAYADFEDEGVPQAIEFPQLPDAWRLLSANPSKSQYALKL